VFIFFSVCVVVACCWWSCDRLIRRLLDSFCRHSVQGIGVWVVVSIILGWIWIEMNEGGVVVTW
jgi:hypothetical protein